MSGLLTALIGAVLSATWVLYLAYKKSPPPSQEPVEAIPVGTNIPLRIFAERPADETRMMVDTLKARGVLVPHGWYGAQGEGRPKEIFVLELEDEDG